MKKNFKTKVLYFILGALIFGTIGVSAATYFESNAVTYDNTESGLNSTNVQGAIDELYNACKTPATGGNGILEKVDIVTSGDGLYKDEYEEGRYFYKGGNPSNYVTFNNEQAGWRIISVEPDKTIKIIRTTNIEEMVWDSSNTNNWARPATLNTYLNETYYNGLNSTAKNQIVAKNYNIGAVTKENNDLSLQINNENNTTWYGKIALITASEFIRTSSNKNQCGTMKLYNTNHDHICKYTTWLKEDGLWTITPNIGNSTDIYYVHSFIAGVKTFSSSSKGTVYPTVFLSSEVQITGGTGTQNDPFRLS